MSTTVKGRIVGYDERRGELLIRAPCTALPQMMRQEWKEVLVQPIDSRPLSDKQRRSCYAMIGEIADYMGEDKLTAKEYLKLGFMATELDDLNEQIFSLSNAPMSLVAGFQSFLARFIVRHNIPTKVPMISYVNDIQDYVYSCLINKRCCICGKNADLHHVDRVGMGRDRTDIIHEGMEALPLCREHHTEAHNMPDAEFFDKYHLDGGITLDKTLCKIYGLKAKKEEQKC